MMSRLPGSSSSLQVAALGVRNDVHTGEFAEDLRSFYLATGQRIGNVPHFNGRPMQLYQLYSAVIGRGGWYKVAQQNAWEDVAHSLGLPKPCANAGHALKSFYYQYLLKYECTKFNRTPVEDVYEEEDGFKRMILNGPGYSRIPDNLRASCGFLSDLKEEDVYEKLQLSLTSAFPNEVDFSINVFLIRSAEFRLTFARMSLMEALISTTGIFSDHCGHLIGSYNSFIRDTDKDFIRYWKETIEDHDLWRLFEGGNSYDQPLTTDTWASDLFSDLLTTDANEIRITQIATILLNLSLDDSNAVLLAGNVVCLKFSSLCANSKKNAVFELGLHLMTQLCVKIDFPSRQSWMQSVLLKTVHRCIGSSDRQRHLLGLSLVGGMCDIDTRRSCLTAALDTPHCTTISYNLGVPDVSVLIFSLEVMYKLTALGETEATLVAQTSSNVEFLVRLLSVSAEVVEREGGEGGVSGGEGTAPPTFSQGAVVRSQNTAPVAPPVSQQESEETVNWFRRIFDEDESYAMALSDVYKDYTAFCMGGKKYPPLLPTFTYCYQLAFPRSRTANYNLGGKVELCIAGIKRRNPIQETSFPPGGPPETKQEPVTVALPHLNGHSHHHGSVSPLTVSESSDMTHGSGLSRTVDGSGLNRTVDGSGVDDGTVVGPEKRQKKTSESSLIRSLLATKINRKQSNGSNDGLLNHTTSTNSSHSFEDWRTPVEPDRLATVRTDEPDRLAAVRADDPDRLAAVRADHCQLSDGIFSDMESNDSLLMTPPARKGAVRSRSASVNSDVSAAPKRKPTAKRKKKEPIQSVQTVQTVQTVQGTVVHGGLSNGVGGVNGFSNGDSHGAYDDSSSSVLGTSVVVPYVLPDPKPVKKVRGRPKTPSTNGGVTLVNGGSESGGLEDVGSLGGLGEEGARKKKKPRRPVKKAEGKEAGLEMNGLVNGHGVGEGTEQGVGQLPTDAPLSVEGGVAKPKRKPSKRKPKKKAGDGGGSVVNGGVAESGGLVGGEENGLTFVCEWEGCQRVFGQDAAAVFKHNFYDHVPTAVEGCCRWPNCTVIKRQSLSLITHLNETHCSQNELLKNALRKQELKRNGATPTGMVAPSMPLPPPVSYSEHAALHSIQARYGSAVASDFAPEVESSNTRTLRLTAALVLRNISHFSHVGRIKLYKYEHILTISAMQQSEASHIVGECLYYLAVHRKEPLLPL